MEKWQKQTRWPGGTPMASTATLSEARTNAAWGNIFFLPLSPLCWLRLSRRTSVAGGASSPLSLPLKVDKAFLCWIHPTLRAVLTKTMPVSLQRTSTRKVTVARAQGLVVREMFHRNDVGEQGQRNATHPNRPFSGNHDKGTRHVIVQTCTCTDKEFKDDDNSIHEWTYIEYTCDMCTVLIWWVCLHRFFPPPPYLLIYCQPFSSQSPLLNF